MRRPVAVVALSVVLAAVAGGIALAFALSAGTTDAQAPASPSPSLPVTADDYCYVEAMIYYRVEESELARTLLRKEGVDPDASAFAADVEERNADELEDLRAWYLSWADARPVEPPVDGPCGGHGSDHAQMPGMASWSSLQALVDSEPPEAERQFAEILHEQNAGMLALIVLILDGDPHPAVVESAERVREQAVADQETLDALRDGAGESTGP